MAVEEDPQEAGIGTLLVEAGAGGGGGRGGGREGERGGGEGEEGGGAGVLNSENLLAVQSHIEDELSQTNREIGGGYVGVVPRGQLHLSRALHAHRGKKLLQDLHNLESTATKKAMVRFRGAREKGAMIFMEYLAYSEEATMVNPLDLL